jgi:hypothetical protein
MSFLAARAIPRDSDRPGPRLAAEHADPQPCRGDRPLSAQRAHVAKGGPALLLEACLASLLALIGDIQAEQGIEPYRTE